MKRAQAELEAVKLQNFELAESDRLKQQFIAHVSHELRTPLNSIMGFSELLQKRITPDADSQSAEFVKCIRRSGLNLQGLIQELLDLSRIQAKGLTLRPQSFDLCRLITEVTEDLASLAEPKSLTLATDLPATLEVFNDDGRMRQVIVNLVSNAIKFTERGSVTVRLQTPSPDRFVLAVQDTGVGIEPADQAHIFEEFWQVNRDPKLKSKGTGLGLAIVHAIVQAMGGTVTLESTRYLGTTFFVELPRWIQIEPS
jgi:signal transduction histidine kinase